MVDKDGAPAQRPGARSGRGRRRTLAVWSMEPVARTVLLGSNARHTISAVCPFNV